MLEVVFPPARLVLLLFLILFETLAGSSGIGRAGWPVLKVFEVEMGLANGWMTLETLVSSHWCVAGFVWVSLSCEKVSSPVLVCFCVVLEISYLLKVGVLVEVGMPPIVCGPGVMLGRGGFGCV